MTNILAKAGQLVVFSNGEYSDYSYGGSYVALQDITDDFLNEVRKELLEEDEVNNSVGYWDRSFYRFEPRLIQKGYILEVSLNEIHVGSYGQLDEF